MGSFGHYATEHSPPPLLRTYMVVRTPQLYGTHLLCHHVQCTDPPSPCSPVSARVSVRRRTSPSPYSFLLFPPPLSKGQTVGTNCAKPRLPPPPPPLDLLPSTSCLPRHLRELQSPPPSPSLAHYPSRCSLPHCLTVISSGRDSLPILSQSPE